MHSKVASLAIVIAVCLIHFSYVDFRYRHRGSVMWFWLAGPAPTTLWISRGAILACFVVALATLYFGVNVAEVVAMIVLLVVHIATLIVVEVREEDWVPPPPPPEE